MERNVSFEEISDGNRYRNSDVVRVGCNDCSGCSSCCENMEELIALDPYDIYRMVSGICKGTGDDYAKSLSALFTDRISLTVDRKVIVPTLKMDEQTGKCTFLNEMGRCSIHDFRSGICRLFPLGRIYEDNGFSYFLQKDECRHENKTKVKIKNWIETPEINRYEKYICDWHYFTKSIQDYARSSNDEEVSQINNYLLKIFYLTPYSNGFYEEFYKRLDKVKALLQ